ncbi:hypothetical protein CUV01_09325 [Paracoccus tegillarcae]|uniref:Uncharacterized protein n=1 Tax=Paracoccus tegillarcae TaxID=1529068 RepID=A0A2K9EZN1_9RHOB|nr:hypothetical protein CUV01_09325 [Paracoccus tegillarcae]
MRRWARSCARSADNASYRNVQTPYVFHNVDDWQFERTDFLAQAVTLPEADPMISVVCLRDTADMPIPPREAGTFP